MELGIRPEAVVYSWKGIITLNLTHRMAPYTETLRICRDTTPCHIKRKCSMNVLLIKYWIGHYRDLLIIKLK